MDYKNVPLELMNRCISNPRFELFVELDELMVVAFIENTYKERQDIADAFDGAITALHIDSYLKFGLEEDALDEFVGWYAYHQNLRSPFYDALETTLNGLKRTGFFQKAVDYLIDCKGEL